MDELKRLEEEEMTLNPKQRVQPSHNHYRDVTL
jgi:hypothetical protein